MLIGIVGFIGSGKGTVGTIISEQYGFTHDSFAAPLKDAVAAIFNWDRELLEGATNASREWREQPDKFWSKNFGEPFSPRLALQLMGTEAGREVFHKDIWVIALLNRSINRNTVITDVRFKNEIKLIHENSGMIVRVKRGDDPQWFNIAERANSGDELALKEMRQLGIHISEWDWIGSPIDYIISNDGSLEDLKDEIREFATKYIRGH